MLLLLLLLLLVGVEVLLLLLSRLGICACCGVGLRLMELFVLVEMEEKGRTQEMSLLCWWGIPLQVEDGRGGGGWQQRAMGALGVVVQARR